MEHPFRKTFGALLAPTACIVIGIGSTVAATEITDRWTTGRHVAAVRDDLGPGAEELSRRLAALDERLARAVARIEADESTRRDEGHPLAVDDGVTYFGAGALEAALVDATEIVGGVLSGGPVLADGAVVEVPVERLDDVETGPGAASTAPVLLRAVRGPGGAPAGWVGAVLDASLADGLVVTPGIWTTAVHDGRTLATSAGRAHLVAVTSRAVPERPGWAVQALATPSSLADPLPVTVAGVGATATILLAAALGVWSIQSRRRRAVEHRLACTYQESRVDALTGLANRVQLMEWLDAEVATCRRTQRRLGLMFIDVDRFKTVNDTMGHAVGDELLKEVANRLGASVRAGDHVGRLAGDEFVIAFPGVADPATLGELAERVARAFDEPVDLSTGPFFASLSIGLAITDGDVEDLHTLLAQADAAMYVAKGTPGSHYAFFDEALRAEADNRHATGEALRAGIAAGELSLSYQPIVAVPDGDVAAVEAFIRWNRPGIGVLTPASFLDVAEETGLISVVGRWVLTQACRQAAAWNPPASSRPMPVAVNVSERELLAPGFVAGVRAALADTGLAPALLSIELTESLALDRRVVATGVLSDLQAVGVGLVIDDFGLRHGSLGLLKQLDLAMVKIHGSIAKAVTDDEAERAVVGAVVNLARVLGAVVVAESVETPAQLQALHQLGVSHMQGHLLLPPVPPAELGPMAEDRRLGDLSGLTTVGVLGTAAGGRLVDLVDNGADGGSTGSRDATPSGHRPFRLARVDRRR